MQSATGRSGVYSAPLVLICFAGKSFQNKSVCSVVEAGKINLCLMYIYQRFKTWQTGQGLIASTLLIA